MLQARKEIYEYEVVDHIAEREAISGLYNSVYYSEMGIARGAYKNDEYDPYAIHLLARKNQQAVGYLRIIQPSPHGFPALELMQPRKFINLDSCVEFSRFQLLDSHRKKTMVGFRLMQEGFRLVVAKGFKNILIDVFVDCPHSTYELFKSIGFEDCSEMYEDTRFVDSKCILMHFHMKNLGKVPHDAHLNPKFKPNIFYSFHNSVKNMHEVSAAQPIA